jgi:hypothetical protein
MIPDFDYNNVLPPHKGDPRIPSDLSPYTCTTLDMVQKFATSRERIEILTKFINFRIAIRQFGMQDNAFQWIDGSFIENIEAIERRAPRDIDVITFFFGYNTNFLNNFVQNMPEFQDPVLSKHNYKVDHYPVEIDADPLSTLYAVKYWTMLFTHNRIGVWKGILELEINTPNEDENALVYMQNLQP